jgi:Bacterial Ig-like domain (group 3)/Beta-propeller repeat
LDSTGDAYVVGILYHQSGRFANGEISFVDKLDPTGSILTSNSYLGVFGFEIYSAATGIAVDSAGYAYLSGVTNSKDFPTRRPFQAKLNGRTDGFVSKIDPRVATVTVLSSSPDPSTYGQAVTFTAVVSSAVGAPLDGETVAFMRNSTTLGTATMSGGSASFTTSTLKVGAISVKAVYSGDTNLAASASKLVKQVVEKVGH